MASSLRVGILCHSPVLESWQAMSIRELSWVKGVEIIVIYSHREQLSPTGRLQRQKEFLKRAWKLLRRTDRLWILYDRFWLRPRAKPFRYEDLSSLFKNFKQVQVQVDRLSYTHYAYPQEAIEEIQNLQLDLILRFDLNILTGAILTAAKYGVWSFHHGNEQKYRGLPPGFWEIYQNDPICGVVLQKLTERLDGGAILKRGFYGSNLRSHTATLEAIFMNSAVWPAKLCLQILAGSFNPNEIAASSTTAPIFKTPRDWHMLSFWLRIFFRKISYAISSTFLTESWCVGVLPFPIHEILQRDLSQTHVHWLKSKTSSIFFADPFGYEKDGQHQILFETYDYRNELGQLASVIFNSNTGSFSKIKPEFNQEHHLAYPFVFEADGKILCMPENAFSSSLAIYDLESKENRWKNPQVILWGLRAHDPTLYFHDGIWYLFFTDGDLDANVDLQLFWSRELTGPWKPHLQNPIKTDVRSSRSAGAIFKSSGMLIRPSQDDSVDYGYGVSLNRILKLSPTEYQEETIKVLHPPHNWKFNRGLHTLNSLGQNFTLIDSKRRQFIWIYSYRLLKARLLRQLGKRPTPWGRRVSP